MSRNHGRGDQARSGTNIPGRRDICFVHVFIITSGTLSRLNIDYDAVIDERDPWGSGKEILDGGERGSFLITSASTGN
jgi:hypothetical protein